MSGEKFVPRVDAPADTEANNDVYWFVFQNDRLVVVPGDADAVTVPRLADPAALGITPLRRQYLGYVENGTGTRVHCYSAECDADAPLGEGLAAEGLRQLYTRLDDVFFSIGGRAVQIVDWDRNHQFCGRCGTPTEPTPHERARRCPRCGLSSYPRISPATICAVTRRDEDGERILLARNHRFPPGRYSVLAGFVEPGESLEECVAREIHEEVGIYVKNIRYFGSQPWPFPNSLML
ncbi:MAG: NAD(+) diphosphatase, partial [Caldilineaceae bacterium]|nr:NAD(+) diphosphatase [Caldilineaceae bacterium]